MSKKMGEPGVTRGIINLFRRTAVGVAGVGLMLLGIAMGLTMVMLPVGIIVGLAGATLPAGALMACPEPR